MKNQDLYEKLDRLIERGELTEEEAERIYRQERNPNEDMSEEEQ